MGSPRSLALAVCLGGFALLLGESARADESVRLAVGRFPSALIIEGDHLEARTGDGAVVPSANGRLKLRATARGIDANGTLLSSDLVRVRAPSTLALSGHRYHKELEVRFRRYDKKPELLVVHPIDLETYVTGIVSSELPGGWPLEAYKAQAVAARTFALWQKYRRLDLPYHMESSVLDQVYGGVEREHALAEQAARETRGLVLSWDRHLAQAYFHASCGDRTESAREGWAQALPYLPGSMCKACSAANRYAWTTRLKKRDVDQALSRVLREPLESLTIEQRTASGRMKSVRLRGATRSATLAGTTLRQLIGYSALPSTWIESFARDGDAWVVHGRGSGHGVGMCQWGARGLALRGKAFRDILGLYYPGAGLSRVY